MANTIDISSAILKGYEYIIELADTLSANQDGGINDCDTACKIERVIYLVKALQHYVDINHFDKTTDGLYTQLLDATDDYYGDVGGLDLNLVIPNTIIGGGGGSGIAQWGYITGDIYNQADLIALLANKADIGDPQPPVDIAAPSWVVYSTTPFGKYTNGQTVPAASSAFEQYKSSWTNIPAPTYLTPIATLTSTPSTSGLEVGQTLNVNLPLSFNQRNGGAETAREIRKNGVVLGATTDMIVISTTPISYLGNISYAQGAVLNNQAGIPDPNGRINAGNVNSNTINYVGSYFNFFGVGVIAINSAQVRALAGKTTANTFTLTIPAGQTQASFAYPATKADIVHSSVKYVEGFNSDVGNTFTKSFFNVNDAGGAPVAYKICTVVLPAPETGTVTYNVTLP